MNYLSILRKESRNVNSFLAFLLFVCMSMMPFMVQAQQNENVTLNVNNETVENVLGDLSKQTGLKFFYDQSVVDNAPYVTIHAVDVPLQTVLNEIGAQTQLSFNRDNNTIVVGKIRSEHQRTITIKGTVLDSNGISIIGANVLVKGTTNGVVTDMDGDYILQNVPENAII